MNPAPPVISIRIGFTFTESIPFVTLVSPWALWLISRGMRLVAAHSGDRDGRFDGALVPGIVGPINVDTRTADRTLSDVDHRKVGVDYRDEVRVAFAEVNREDVDRPGARVRVVEASKLIGRGCGKVIVPYDPPCADVATLADGRSTGATSAATRAR